MLLCALLAVPSVVQPCSASHFRFCSCNVALHVLRFPALQDRISAVVRSFITAAEERAKTMLVSLFECETAYINTDHPDYIGMQRAWKEHMASKDGAENSGSESVSHDSRSHSPNRRTTVPLAHSRHVRCPLSATPAGMLLNCAALMIQCPCALEVVSTCSLAARSHA